MPALAPITINDGTSTPVPHTFSPVTTDGYVALLKERTSVPLANPGLDVSVRPPVGSNGLYRVRMVIKMPQSVTVDGVVKVDHIPTISIEMLASERSTEQNRKDLRLMAANLLAHASVVTVLEKLEPLY